MVYGYNNAKVLYEDIVKIIEIGTNRLKRSIHITDYYLIQKNLSDPSTKRFHNRYQLARKDMVQSEY